MNKKHLRPFKILHNLTGFTHEGKHYRKTGNLTAIRSDDKVSVFYPNEVVNITTQPPRTQPLFNLYDNQLVTLPGTDYDPVEYNVGDLRALEVDPMTEATIIGRS